MFVGSKKLSSVKDKQGSNSHYDDVVMGPYSEVLECHSEYTAEAQYEECGEGVTSSGITMEKNPAYQSIDHM